MDCTHCANVSREFTNLRFCFRTVMFWVEMSWFSFYLIKKYFKRILYLLLIIFNWVNNFRSAFKDVWINKLVHGSKNSYIKINSKRLFWDVANHHWHIRYTLHTCRSNKSITSFHIILSQEFVVCSMVSAVFKTKILKNR
jgi:hypothetical protein